MSIYKKLLNIQTELKAPKGQYNNFGKYSYRSCEDILEALKPLINKNSVALIVGDEIVQIGERYYIKATAKLIDVETNEEIINTAYAREEESKKGMDGSQVTGASSSYARKYALNGFFGIDDNKDSDTTNDGGNANKSKNSSNANNGTNNGNTNNTNNNNRNSAFVTEKQIKRLYAIANECEFPIKRIKDGCKKLYGKDHLNEMTTVEYDNLIKMVKEITEKEKTA